MGFGRTDAHGSDCSIFDRRTVVGSSTICHDPAHDGCRATTSLVVAKAYVAHCRRALLAAVTYISRDSIDLGRNVINRSARRCSASVSDRSQYSYSRFGTQGIATDLRDQHGALLPVFFESFGQWRGSLFVYAVAVVFKVAGPKRRR